jgi:mannose-1-phosphate guanylyltransferase / mannose-6-phosphate isomerase
VLRRLEFHYTPKHASWLNMVEIEIGVLKGQCLDRRIDSCHRLMAEIDARQAQRNQIGARITRMFSTDSILSSKIRLLGQAPSLGVACGFIITQENATSAARLRRESMSKIQPVIMCGGSGMRVWPESRESLPKQFIPLIGDRSTFQSIVVVVSDRAIFEPAAVITNFDYRFRVAEQLKEIGAEATILLEPERRDSAAAVGAAAAWAAMRDPKTIVAVLAADHVFKDGKAFAVLCAQAGVAAAAGEIVTFGVTPDHPATGYGYIHPGEPLAVDPEVCRVERFVEKPNEERARSFIDSAYLWNSGNFVFSADVMLEELARFEPEIAAAASKAAARASSDLGFVVLDRESFIRAPKTSIDYAVMERTHRAAVLPADVGWSDVGEWSTVWRLSPQDADGNSLRGRAVAIDSSNVLVRSDGHLAAVIGLKDIVVVATGDAVLVAHKSQTDKVKQLVERLKATGHPEATQHRQMYRPWGYYQSIDQGGRYQVKRIVVRPCGRLSLQKHYHRAEHWIVVRGAAEVTIDGKVQLAQENESIYLPIGCEHRLANPGKIDLELIEVQTGSYLGEDDIIRIDDIYNRHL